MFISAIKIENFRLFGAGEHALVVPLNSGLTAIVGENDSGKTALIDALRIVLGTRDQDVVRLEPTDFHQPAGNVDRTDEIRIRLTFSGLTSADSSAFAEYLTYAADKSGAETTLIVTWVAKRSSRDGGTRRFIPTEWRTGANSDGPLLDLNARFLLTATYMRPLRDAERAMSAGRGSRLSQILQYTKEIKDSGIPFDKKTNPNPDPTKLSVLGLGDYANHLFEVNPGVCETRRKLNKDYLAPLSFAHDPLNARIGVSGSGEDSIRLRQLLEKLEVALIEDGYDLDAHTRGLGSNNLLFMACEMLLLATENDGFPILLIEEPEAHLHPQRQLRLMSFLQDQAKQKRADGQQIQIIVTTHSPNLASEIQLDNMILMQGKRAFPLSQGRTALSASDYKFLERFLDVTKANLFFARSVLIVEGDAESILLPTIARLVGKDFHEHGVSVVNVGGVGLGRYARIFMRANPEQDGTFSIPVACITDMDVMPDCAPWIVGLLDKDQLVPKLGEGTRRKWRVKSDHPGTELADLRKAKREKASGQTVETFVADEWTLEYDLAFFGLSEELWLATECALCDDKLNAGTVSREQVENTAAETYKTLAELSPAERASTIYARFTVDRASKPIAAQYLADVLEKRVKAGTLKPDDLRKRLPSYLLNALMFVTSSFPEGDKTPGPLDGVLS